MSLLVPIGHCIGDRPRTCGMPVCQCLLQRLLVLCWPSSVPEWQEEVNKHAVKLIKLDSQWG